MRQTIYVEDKAMVLALEEAKLILELTGFRYSDDKIHERTKWYRNYLNEII